MVDKKSKALALTVAVCLLVTLFPFQVLAYVDTDNIGTAAVTDAKGNWVGGDTFFRGLVSNALTLIGYWDVVNKNTKDKLGKAPIMNLDDASAKSLNMAPGCYTMVDPNTLAAWVEAFNGNLDFVKSVVEQERYELTRDKDQKPFSRYWLRDIAYASGAYIDPDPDKKVVIASISGYPAAIFDEFDEPIIAGEPSSIGIYDESWVLYRQTPGGYPGLTWELQVDGERIAGESIQAMKTDKFKVIFHIFPEEGEYTLTLIVTDGVGRQTKNEITVTVEPGEEIIEEEDPDEGGSDGLTFQAVDQLREDKRPANTAKWTDWVTATLKAKKPSPPKGSITSWSVTSAKLTYPKKAEKFTFGHPLPPEGTVTVDMNPSGHGATVEFMEDWSMNGAFIYDSLAGKMVDGPTKYQITASYTVDYTYKWKTSHRGSDGKKHTTTHTGSGTDSGTVSGNLLVNGTGVNSRGQ